LVAGRVSRHVRSLPRQLRRAYVASLHGALSTEQVDASQASNKQLLSTRLSQQTAITITSAVVKVIAICYVQIVYFAQVNCANLYGIP